MKKNHSLALWIWLFGLGVMLATSRPRWYFRENTEQTIAGAVGGGTSKFEIYFKLEGSAAAKAGSIDLTIELNADQVAGSSRVVLGDPANVGLPPETDLFTLPAALCAPGLSYFQARHAAS